MNENKLKPGWKTTEFWLSGLAIALGFFMEGGWIGDDSLVAKIVGGLLVLLGALGYTAGRSMVKKAELVAKALQKEDAENPT